MQFQRIQRSYKKVLNEQFKKERTTIAWERLEISLRKSEIPREYFMQGWV